MPHSSGSPGELAVGDMPPRRAHISAVDRHQLDELGQNTYVKRTNTMVVPGIDVRSEVELINQGQAQRVGDSRYLINDRVYVIKPDGAAYPESGAGVINVSRPVMLLTRELIRHGGPTGSFHRATEQNPTYTAEVQREALDVFNTWKRGREDVHK